MTEDAKQQSASEAPPVEVEMVEDGLKGLGRVITEGEVSDEQKRAEAKIVRKVDLRLIPILGVLYSIAGLDRVNLSNARVAGMDEDLGFDQGNRYSIALLVFFVSYFLFEIPSTLSLRFVGPRLFLNSLVFCWGIVMLGMGFTDDWRVVVVCRFLIGVFEAGFLPCCVYLLGSWYMRFEVQQRIAWWYLINLFVSAFGNILAYALIQLDGTHGIEGWRWIFIIEGTITIGFAFIGYIFTLPFPDQLLGPAAASDTESPSPSSGFLSLFNGKSNFLTASELATVLARVERDRADAVPDPLTRRKVFRLLLTWELWAYGLLFMTCSAPIYAFAYFIQIIVSTFNGGSYSTAVVFLLCAPPYLASMLWTAAVAYLADRTRLRMPWMVLNAAVTLTGLLLTAYHDSTGVRYFGVFMGVSGCNANLPTIIAFQSNNVRGDSRRSMGAAVQMLFAAVGGVYASTTFLQSEYPTYETGVWCAVATQALLVLLVVVMGWRFWSLNKGAEERGEVIMDDEGFRHTY